MRVKISRRWVGRCVAFGMMAGAARGMAGAPQPAGCKKIVMTGEVSAGQEWKTAIGEGWIFRVMPIQPVNAGYSGWDLVMDREQPAGFPDALLLATPPYDSINEREVGTTFGVRAQDAIGWNPRSFRFLTDPPAFMQGQQLFRRMHQAKNTQNPDGAAPGQGLLSIARNSSAGKFQIVDAHLTPGVANAASFAEGWAVQSARTSHTFEPAPGGKSSPLGSLNWMRFSISLWLPASWKAPAGLLAAPAACSE